MLKYAFSEGNKEAYFERLPQNCNAIKPVTKKMLMAFGSTHICDKAFSVMYFRKFNFIPVLLLNSPLPADNQNKKSPPRFWQLMYFLLCCI
jgi:hypothetical protein